MKVEKIQQRLLLITSILLLAALGAAPASAQIDPNQPIPPTPLAREAADSIVYLPIISRPPPPDLSIGGFEVTQATQNLNNSVPLVAGKATVVRVYAQTDASSGLGGVYVSVSGTRNGASLTGSPLRVGPKSVYTTLSRGNLNASFNFSLPSTWLSGAVTLQIRVDPDNLVDEGSKESNNTTTFLANFNNVPALEVKVVPIRYYDPETGREFPPASSTFLGPGLLRMYPISTATVSRRSTVLEWDDNLRVAGNWERLLVRIASIKAADGAPPSRVYYGLVPVVDEVGLTWFVRGTSGLSYLNIRVSAGLANAQEYGLDGADNANHEIGHNLGREHAPCGDVSDVDNDYPYNGGLIGQYGLRIDRMELYDPAEYADIMGYCEPIWISDYNYRALYNAQMATASTTQVSLAAVEGLLVRAYFTEDGAIQTEPSYVFTGVPEQLPAESDFILELLDEQGGLVASYPLPVLRAGEEQLRNSAIVSLVPLPGEPFARLRIIEKGQPLAERPMAFADPTLLAKPTIETGEQGALLRWGAAATPALVRYTQDEGKSWNTLVIDHLGGELALDTQELPEGTLHFEIILADQAGSTLTLDWGETR